MITVPSSQAVLLAVWAVTLGTTQMVRSDPHYHVVKRIVLNRGSAAYLSVDATRRRLYGADTTVIDIDSNKIVGTVPPFSGHGFALAPDLGKGLGRRGVIFDLSTLAQVGKVDAQGEQAAYDPMTHHAFLISTDGVIGVDMISGSVIGRVSLRHGLSGNVRSAVSDAHGHLFVNVLTFPTPELGEAANQGDERGLRSGKAEIAVLDAGALTVLRSLPLRECGGLPTGLSMDRQNKRLFVSCPDKLLVVDPDTGGIVAVVPVVGHAVTNAFDSAAGIVLSPARGGHMTIVHEDTPNVYRVVETVTTADGGGVVAVDEHTHRAFLVGGSDPIHVIVVAP
jgi:hypothetical protein